MGNRVRVVAMCAAFLLGGGGAVWPEVASAQSDANSQTYAIPAGDLNSALRQFSQQSRVQLIYPTEITDGMKSAGLSGSYTPAEALRRLLSGSGLESEQVNDKTVVIKKVLAPSRAPAPKPEQSSEKTTEAVEDERVKELETILVTGSRLKRSQIEGPQPVNIYTQDDITRSGRTSIGEFLNTLPEVDSTIASEAAAFAFSDLSTVQLRGLPVGTTLVLVNGRDPGVTGVQEGRAFNLNNIPAAAVQRIEVVPQGSSAIYGSDALAGVINIILKKDFHGLALDGHYGQADDWNDVTGSIVWGRTWSRGSITLLGSYLRQGRLSSDQRMISSDYDQRRFGGIDRRSTLCNQGNVYSVDGQNLPGLQFPQAGVPTGATGHPNIGDFLATQGQVNRCSNPQDLIHPRQQVSLMLNGAYDISDNLNLRLEVLHSTYDQSPTNQGPRTFSRVPVPASNAFNPFGTDVLVDYAFTDLATGFDREYDFQRYLVGLQGAMGPWEWEAGAWMTHDKSDRLSLTNNTRGWNVAAINAALASSDPNSALNLFVPGSAASPDVLAGLFFANSDTRETHTRGFDAVARGPLLALAAGSLDVAFGVEYQTESIEQQNHDADIASFSFNLDSHRYALFAEGRVPILAGPNSAYGPRLALTAAVRRDEYSDVGGQTTPSVGIEWRPNRTLLVRASYAEAFKAPGLIGLKGEQFNSEAQVVDPRRGGEAAIVNVTSGGNTDLVPEFGDATSIGIIWDSEAIAGLQAELTWWRVNLTDRIVTEPSPSLIIDSETLFPGRVQREPPENGLPGTIISVDRTAINLSELDVAGFDLDLRYRFATRLGNFTPRFRATRTYLYDVRLTETAPTEDRLDVSSTDAWAHSLRSSIGLSWDYGRYSSSIAARYASEYRDRIMLPDGSFGMLGGCWIFDTNFRYDFTAAVNRTGLSSAHLSLGVSNLFDREPQFSNGSILGYDGRSVDIRGRILYAAVGFQW